MVAANPSAGSRRTGSAAHRHVGTSLASGSADADARKTRGRCARRRRHPPPGQERLTASAEVCRRWQCRRGRHPTTTWRRAAPTPRRMGRRRRFQEVIPSNPRGPSSRRCPRAASTRSTRGLGKSKTSHMGRTLCGPDLFACSLVVACGAARKRRGRHTRVRALAPPRSCHLRAHTRYTLLPHFCRRSF